MDVGNIGACGLNCGYGARIILILCERLRLELWMCHKIFWCCDQDVGILCKSVVDGVK